MLFNLFKYTSRTSFIAEVTDAESSILALFGSNVMMFLRSKQNSVCFTYDLIHRPAYVKESLEKCIEDAFSD